MEYIIKNIWGVIVAIKKCEDIKNIIKNWA